MSGEAAKKVHSECTLRGVYGPRWHVRQILYWTASWFNEMLLEDMRRLEHRHRTWLSWGSMHTHLNAQLRSKTCGTGPA